MKLIKTLVATFVLIGTLAGSAAIIATLVLIAKFPALLVALLSACWMLSQMAPLLRVEL